MHDGSNPLLRFVHARGPEPALSLDELTLSFAALDELTRASVQAPSIAGLAVFRTGDPGASLYRAHESLRGPNNPLRVESAPGAGSRFTLWLPRAEAEGRITPTPSDLAPDPLRGDETLLLVEDQDAVRASIRAILARYGYRVHEARDAASALTLAQEHPDIALVITDVVMPRMGGRELVERLTALRPDLAVIFMSGYAEDFALGEGAAGAAVTYLQKPFAPELLLERIRELLAARPASRPAGDGAPPGEPV